MANDNNTLTPTPNYANFITQNKGPRKGQKFQVKRGKSGLRIKVYQNGDTALVSRDKQPAGMADTYAQVVRRKKYHGQAGE